MSTKRFRVRILLPALAAILFPAVAHAAVVLMVMITTLVTPPLLKWSLSGEEPGDSPER